MFLVVARVASKVAESNTSREKDLETLDDLLITEQEDLTWPTAVCHTVPDANWSLRQLVQSKATPSRAFSSESALPTKMIVVTIGRPIVK